MTMLKRFKTNPAGTTNRGNQEHAPKIDVRGVIMHIDGGKYEN